MDAERVLTRFTAQHAEECAPSAPDSVSRGAVYKPGKVAVVLSGRYAGKKARSPLSKHR